MSTHLFFPNSKARACVLGYIISRFETLREAANLVADDPMESELSFNHLGVAVSDIEKALTVYEDLFGYRLLSGPFDDPQQQASVCFIGTGDPANVVFELVAPLTESSHVARLLAKGAGAYHVCYDVDDIDATVATLRGKGCLLVSRPTPAVAFQGRRIAWLYTPTRQLIELVER